MKCVIIIWWKVRTTHTQNVRCNLVYTKIHGGKHCFYAVCITSHTHFLSKSNKVRILQNPEISTKIQNFDQISTKIQNFDQISSKFGENSVVDSRKVPGNSSCTPKFTEQNIIFTKFARLRDPKILQKFAKIPNFAKFGNFGRHPFFDRVFEVKKQCLVP